MIIKSLLPTILAVAISTCLLTACGGGGSNGMVRVDPAGDPPPPPPPPPPTEACPAPVTGNCTVDVPITSSDQEMTGGRDSDYALVKDGEGQLNLADEWGAPGGIHYRFSGGTTVADGTLQVAYYASLDSDVVVQTSGRLVLLGTLNGGATNHGEMLLWDTVVGDVMNDGVLTPGADIYDQLVPARIEGNFTQTSAGTLDAVIGATSGGFISVTGRADIDGTLRLVAYTDDFGPYPLPAAPLSLQVLHADGGVFGKFATWTSPGLFITGAPRYLANDVYFDAASISAAQAMAAAQAGDALTLSAAHNFDVALGEASGVTPSPDARLTATQRQFLVSAARIQRIQDYGQAVRTFDSLSGHGYAGVADALLQQAAMPAPGLIERVGNLHAGAMAGAWSTQPAMFAAGAGAFSSQRSGVDQWLNERLLAGSSISWTSGNLQFDRSGGGARDQSSQWDFYMRRNGRGDSYVLGDVGYNRHQINLTRQIDLGVGKANVHATRNLDVEHAYIEMGRDFRVHQGWLTPFAALSHAALHGGGFTEQGSTGFELVAQPSFHARTDMLAGLRLGQYWRLNTMRWLQLDIATGYRQLLRAQDDANAAFTGMPDVQFALAGMPRQRNTGWLQMNLGAGSGNWAWLLSYDMQAGAEATSMDVKLRF